LQLKRNTIASYERQIATHQKVLDTAFQHRDDIDDRRALETLKEETNVPK
jgi:hypothetical protein